MDNELINQLAILQLALPLGVIFGSAKIRVATLVGALLRMTAILGLLFYTVLAGMWLFTPWWTPIILGALQLLITSWQVRRLRARGPAGSLWKAAEAGVALVGIVGVATLILPAVQGRPPPDVAIDLFMPVGSGRYLVISGGAADQFALLNARPSKRSCVSRSELRDH
jgi:hypothetical protein